MTRIRLTISALTLLAGLMLSPPGWAQTEGGGSVQEPPSTAARDLFVGVGKSLVVDSPVVIQRVSVANGEVAEAVAVTPREILVNGLAAGETSFIIWQEGGNRLIFDLKVRPDTTNLEAVRRRLGETLAGQDVSLDFENDTVFLRGTVEDLVSADRAVMIASTLGTTVNLLRVKVPPTEAQILLKVRFANVDRSTSSELGVNLFSTGALNTIGAITSGGFSPPTVQDVGGSSATTFTLTDALNVFLFRPDLNLGATIKALQAKNMLQMLAEPNVLAINGKPASFLAGGEFPFPTMQGGASVGSVTIQFREFGIRINFVPTVTPRGTIRLQVTPEVSALDFANGLVFQGFNIPALSTRRVQTEIELESGQSFAIGGLLDNRVVENMSKIPGLGDIPFFGKLFRSRTLSKNNSELLVMVTPEVVRPIPTGNRLPEIDMPKAFFEGASTVAPRTPGIGETGPVPVTPPTDTITVEELIKIERPGQTGAAAPGTSIVPASPVPAGGQQLQMGPQQAPSVSPASSSGTTG